MNVILEGVAGSKSFGLDTPESDTDLHGVFLAPIESFLGLQARTETYHSTSDDVDRTHHELGKFCKLALQANPTILEALYLNDYTVKTELGQELLDLRKSFLSKRCVQTYGGYAKAQFIKLMRAESSERRVKHCRHMFRLLWQGEELLRTGHLNVRLTPGKVSMLQSIIGLATTMEDGSLEARFRAYLKNLDDVTTTSPLPTEPDFTKVNDWLVNVRISQLSQRNIVNA